jgi:hypothetical protein
MGIRVHIRANCPLSAVLSRVSSVAVMLTAAMGVNAFGQIQSGTAYTVVNRATAQAIDDPSGVTTTGEQQQEWACNGNTQQNWIFTSVGSGYYTLQNQKSLLYLDTNGSEIVQNPKSGSTTQNWLTTYISNGFYYLTNESSGEVLEVPGGNTNNGTLLYQTTNGDYPYQQWYVTTVNTCRTGQFSGSSNGWTAVPIPGPGSGQTMNVLSLFGTITMTSSSSGFVEDLFGVGFVPNGTSCASTSGSTPNTTIWSNILKSESTQTITIPINYLPWSVLGGGGVQAPANTTNCMFFGFDGDAAGTVNIAAIVVAETTRTMQEVGLGAEVCFNTSGCATVGESNLNPETQAYEGITNITTASTLNFIWGNVSDAARTAPSGTWIASTDIYVFHGSECPANGYTTWNWTTQSIPGDANHLLNLQELAVGETVGQQEVYQTVNYPLKAGDCIITMTGVPVDPGEGQFDNEIQLWAIITP